VRQRWSARFGTSRKVISKESGDKTPRSEVGRFAPRLEQREQCLPWTRVILFGTSASGPEGCHHHRPRQCLLKGCERLFWPRHWRSHFCSEACQQKARRWRALEGKPAVSLDRSRQGATARTVTGATDSGSVNGKRRQLTRMGRARASAYRPPGEDFRRAVPSAGLLRTFHAAL